MGRVLNLKETVSGNVKTLYWQQEDTGDILCKYTVQDNRLMDAHAVIREGSERVTAYEYTPKIGNTRLFLKTSQSADDGVDITYQLLTAIRHPSGAGRNIPIRGSAGICELHARHGLQLRGTGAQGFSGPGRPERRNARGNIQLCGGRTGPDG